jgi:uncharacterized protein
MGRNQTPAEFGKKHGIDFPRAALVFDGRPAIMIYSPRTGEDRWQTTADVEGRLITVIWTWRDQRCRIIRRERHEMQKQGPIVRYTLSQIRDLVARGEDRTDWAAVDRKSEADLEADIASDSDGAAGTPTETWVRVPPGFDVRVIKKSA